MFGVTAAGLHYAAASRAAASILVRWLKVARPGFFEEFRIVAAKATVAVARGFRASTRSLRFRKKKEGPRAGFGLDYQESERPYHVQGTRPLRNYPS